MDVRGAGTILQEAVVLEAAYKDSLTSKQDFVRHLVDFGFVASFLAFPMDTPCASGLTPTLFLKRSSKLRWRSQQLLSGQKSLNCSKRGRLPVRKGSSL